MMKGEVMKARTDFWFVIGIAVVIAGVALAYVSYDHPNVAIQSLHVPASMVAAITIGILFCGATVKTGKN